MVERLHGTYRERDEVMRGLDKKDTATQMMDNYRTYYNFLRKHQGLNGKTPSELVGIDLNLSKNKWMELLNLSNNK